MEYQGKEVAATMVIKINGDIISNDWKPVYDFFEIESTCPADISGAISALSEGEKLEVKINSGGGDAIAGQEIYTMLRECPDVEIEIQSIAASAASIIAMAGHCSISPVGMIMIHCVSTGAWGNHKALEKEADTLRQWDAALATAYCEKTGKPKDEVIRMMDKETWLTADRALELGFVDEISVPAEAKAAAVGNFRVTPDMMRQYQEAMNAKAEREAEKQKLLNELANYGR